MRELSLELIPFKNNNLDLELHVSVTRERDNDSNKDTLTLKYSVLGKDAHKIDFDVHNSEQLWENTCFEFFIKEEKSSKNYYEVNLASNLKNHCYYFNDYRDNGLSSDLEKEEFRPSHIYFEKDVLTCTLSLSNFKKIDTEHSVILAISAVIKVGNETYYYALKHPYDRPDFHSPDGFCVELN